MPFSSRGRHVLLLEEHGSLPKTCRLDGRKAGGGAVFWWCRLRVVESKFKAFDFFFFNIVFGLGGRISGKHISAENPVP